MTKHPTTSAEAGVERMSEMVAEWQKAGLGALSWMNPLFARSMTEMSNELVRFVSERISEDVKLQAEVLQCRDPAKLREIQGRFLKTAFEQYSAETGKLVRMNQAVLDEVTGRPDG